MTTTRSHAQALTVGAVGLALGAAMFGGAAVSAPHASAACSLSPADDQYIKLLAQNKMVHNADYSDCHEAAEGGVGSPIRFGPTRIRSARARS